MAGGSKSIQRYCVSERGSRKCTGLVVGNCSAGLSSKLHANVSGAVGRGRERRQRGAWDVVRAFEPRQRLGLFLSIGWKTVGEFGPVSAKRLGLRVRHI